MHLSMAVGLVQQCGLIISNPPWGAKFGKSRKNYERFVQVGSLESFSLFMLSR